MEKTGTIQKLIKTLLPILIIIFILAGTPLLFILYQSSRTGMTFKQVVHRMYVHMRFKHIVQNDLDIKHLEKGKKTDFFISKPVGNQFTKPPRISNIQTVDLDKDGFLDILVCDALNHYVSWIRQYPKGVYNELVCASNITAPSHIQAYDFDNDNDLDLMISVLGMLFPNNDKIGSVVILENTGNEKFKKHIIIENIARVSDVRAGDLDGDGDTDLAVAQFGYDDGETRWMENTGNYKFKSHILQTLSGPINCEIIDIDNDNDLDIISLVSQEWEEIYIFINNGKGNFKPRLIYGSQNDDFGSSGISLVDIDKDNDIDILFTNGDAFDYIPPLPRPWHGVQVLENLGNLKFDFHRIGSFGGAYNCRTIDIDKDGDNDLFVVSAFNLWDNIEAQSLIWYENIGKWQFIRHDITNTPTHILCLETGDFNNDGRTDLVTANMHVYPPYDRMARISIWQNNRNK